MRLAKGVMFGLAALALPAVAIAQVAPATQPASSGEQHMTVDVGGVPYVVVIRHGASVLHDAGLPGTAAERFPLHEDGQTVKTEKATYLGVGVEPAGKAMEAQLKLPAHTGLLVTYLDPDSPAKSAGVAEDDVLTKFNDQDLIDFRQLMVLIRNCKPGDEVKLTLIHQGQEQTLAVKLAEKDEEPIDALIDRETGARSDLPGENQMPAIPREYRLKLRNPGMQDMLMKMLEQDGALTDAPANLKAGKAFMIATVAGNATPQLPAGVDQQQMDFSDGMQLTLSRESAGGLHLLATDKSGAKLFDGVVKSLDQADLPAAVRAKLMQMQAPAVMPAMPWAPEEHSAPATQPGH